MDFNSSSSSSSSNNNNNSTMIINNNNNNVEEQESNSESELLLNNGILPTVQVILRTRDENLAKLEIAILACIFLVTVVGNFIVIMGIYFRRQKMSRMYYFILHLSLADLITAFFNVGTQFIMELTWPEFLGGNIFCKLIKYLQILGPYSSSYVLIMTALDRYQAICYPMSNCNWTAKQSKLMLSLAWGIALLFCIPQLFIFSLEEVSPEIYDCWATFPDYWGAKAYVTWYCLSFFIVPLFVLIFAYTCICRTIWLNVSMKNIALKMEVSNGFNHTNHHHHHDHHDHVDMESTTSFIKSNSQNTINKNSSTTTTTKEFKYPKYPTELNLISNHHQNEQNIKQQSNGVIKHYTTNFTPINDDNNMNDSDTSSPSSSSNINPDPFPSSIIVKYNENKQQKYNNNKNNHHHHHHHHPSVTSQIKTKVKYTWSKIGHDNNSNKNNENLQNLRNDKKNISLDKNCNDGSKQLLMSSNNKLITTTSSPSTTINTVQIITRASTSPNFSTTTAITQPRTHSVRGISRAKIKTIKLTVTIIFCYIICSSPFIAAQLWSTYDPLAYESPFYTGTVFTVLTLLASLNSCVNPWIFLFFNPNLLQDFLRGCRGHHFKFNRHLSGTSPVTGRTSGGIGQR